MRASVHAHRIPCKSALSPGPPRFVKATRALLGPKQALFSSLVASPGSQAAVGACEAPRFLLVSLDC